MRGHASIQGSTDIPTLYNTLPGYLSMPHVDDPRPLHEWLEEYTAPAGWWGHMNAYMVSLLKAWWGAAATAKNEWCFGWLPRIDDDNSHYWTVQQMLEGKVKGYIVAGENPAVGSANGRAQRLGLAKLDWLVVRDFVEIETAAFWYDSPEVESGEVDAGRDRDGGLLPARRRPTSRRTGRSRTHSGCCSGTSRRSSRKATAAPSCGSTSTSAASCASGWRSRRIRRTRRCST